MLELAGLGRPGNEAREDLGMGLGKMRLGKTWE